MSKQNDLKPKTGNQNLVDECQGPAKGISNVIVEMDGINGRKAFRQG